jgi:hypothetical protein
LRYGQSAGPPRGESWGTKSLGLAFRLNLLGRATEVIE